MGFPYPEYKLASEGKGTGRYRVMVQGEPVATLVKNTEGTTITSAITGMPGPARWQVWVGGEDTGHQLESRRDAARLAIRLTSPPMVGEGTYDKYQSLTDVTLWYKGYTFGVSRYDGEREWHVDSQTNPGSWFPEFCNGVGSRCIATLTIKDQTVIGLLEAARTAAVARHLDAARQKAYLD